MIWTTRGMIIRKEWKLRFLMGVTPTNEIYWDAHSRRHRLSVIEKLGDLV